MNIGETWEIIYDTKSFKPSRTFGVIVKITGTLYEFDNGDLVNATTIIRGKNYTNKEKSGDDY